jgi:integrase
MFGMNFSENTPPQLHENLLGNQSVWAERLKNFNTVPEKNKVGNFAEFFLTEARINEKPATADELKKYINKIIQEAGIWTTESDITNTNSDTVNIFITWLNKKNYNPNTHNKVLGIFRRFITRASQEDGLLGALPRNLLLKTHRKRTAIKKVKSYSNIIAQLNMLPPKMRLWSVLALNCGCSSCDLGNLRWEDIDQKTWRLTRKRVKTLTTDPNAPEVTFKLWNITINLLNRLPHREGYLFVSNSKSPMYICDYVKNEKGEVVVRKKDLFGSYWNKLEKKPDFTIGKFRSIGATIIENEGSTFVDKHSTLYLGRMPKGLDDKYYKANQKDFMDKAIDYLGDKLQIKKLKIKDIPKNL